MTFDLSPYKTTEATRSDLTSDLNYHNAVPTGLRLSRTGIFYQNFVPTGLGAFGIGGSTIIPSLRDLWSAGPGIFNYFMYGSFGEVKFVRKIIITDKAAL